MGEKARTPVILGGGRTPIGRFLGGLSPLAAPELGGIAIRAALERSGVDPASVDEVIMGNVVVAGEGQAPARQAAISGGVPATVPAVTVNKVCGSGLKAVMLAAQAVRAGDAQVVVAGGMESMSNVPHYVRGLRSGVKFGDQTLQDGLVLDGLWCPFGNCHMGGHAEYTAAKAGISRTDADEFSLRSHRLAIAAMDGGKFDQEIVVVSIATRRGTALVDSDEGPRRDTSLEALGKLRPAFGADAPADIEELVVTAGNAPGLNDGAAAVVVASLEFAQAQGISVRAEISAYAAAGADPQDLFFAPIAAVKKPDAKGAHRHRGLWSGRVERGFRGAGVGGHEGARDGSGAGERPWWRGGPRTSDRRLGGTHLGDPTRGHGGSGCGDRPGDPLSRWRQCCSTLDPPHVSPDS